MTYLIVLGIFDGVLMLILVIKMTQQFAKEGVLQRVGYQIVFGVLWGGTAALVVLFYLLYNHLVNTL